MKNQKYNLLFLYISLFTALGVFFPFHSIYLQETLNFTSNEIGLLLSISSLLVILSVIFTGIIADKLQNPGFVFILCALASVVFLLPYSFLKPFSIMITLYIFINAFRSSLIPLLDTIAMDYSYKNNQNYGLYRAVGSLTFIISAILMGILLDVFVEYTNLFLYIQLIALLFSVYFMSKQDNIYINNSTRKINFSDVKSLLKNKLFLLIINVMAIAYSVIQVSQAYLSLSIIELGGSNNIVGISILFLVIPEVILFGYINKFLRKYSHHKLMMFSLILLLARWIVLIFTNSLWVLLIVSITHGLIMAFIVLVGMDYIKKIVSPNLLSSSISSFIALTNLYFAIISLFVGLSATNDSYRNSYFVYTIGSILAIIILLFTIYYKKRSVINNE